VLVHAEARELDRTSYVIDFSRLKQAAVESANRFDHLNINEVEALSATGSGTPPRRGARPVPL
jgi:6-pyruvoyl-tetrahydropterin synthase